MKNLCDTCVNCIHRDDDSDCHNFCVAYNSYHPKEDFKVGDEVEWIADEPHVKGVVLSLWGENKDHVIVIWMDGSVSSPWRIRCFEKTGRFFPQIAEVIRLMGEQTC